VATRFDPADLPPEVLAFLAERHVAALTTLRPDGSPHVTPVGFTYDPASGLARVITFARAWKVRNLQARPASRAAVCQVDGRRWLTLEGPATATSDPARNAEGTARYAARYRTPKDRPDRVTIEIAVDRITGSA
jgi:PPOX class probable F420-dependent enzyme